jgi:hypothetical protein
LFLFGSENRETNFFKIIDEDQNKNKIVKALENTDIMFTIKAIFVLSEANMAKNAPIIWYNGAPGGWPTSSFAAVAMYSPQSQKLMVGSTVKVYVNNAIPNVNQPIIVFHLLKLNAALSMY